MHLFYKGAAEASGGDLISYTFMPSCTFIKTFIKWNLVSTLKLARCFPTPFSNWQEKKDYVVIFGKMDTFYFLSAFFSYFILIILPVILELLIVFLKINTQIG